MTRGDSLGSRWISSRRIHFGLVATMLFIHGVLLAYGACCHSATWDEPAHLIAAISHWSLGTFDLYRVNPPLVRLVAGIPLIFMNPVSDWSGYDPSVQSRPEFNIPDDFIDANGTRIFPLLTASRWACIPFSILGAIACHRWSMHHHGTTPAFTALTLWCLSPTILGFGQLIVPDVAAGALGVLACLVHWFWLRYSGWRLAGLLGIALGFAELCKTTWIILPPLWTATWLLCRWTPPRRNVKSDILKGGTRHGEACQFGLGFAIALLVMNAGYGFEGSFQRLGAFIFVSDSLGGGREATQNRHVVGNRFVGTVLEDLPVPMPKNYVLGIDRQKLDFESRLPSYLRGEWKRGGWWYYYVYALLIKEPLGNWVLVGLALYVSLFRKEYNVPWRDELVLLAPAITILFFVSSQTGFNHHMRYVLPALPFIYIWCSKVFRSYEFKHWGIATIATGAFIWSVVSSLSVYPHSLSYFNELVGGPKNGHWHLGNSNTDWGQDLLYLKKWYDKHPDARPLHLAYDMPMIDPVLLGIDYRLLPPHPRSPSALRLNLYQIGPLPGWHAISVNQLHNMEGTYDYFLEFEPVDWIGYTMPIYHITLDEANRVRAKLGLAELEK